MCFRKVGVSQSVGVLLSSALWLSCLSRSFIQPPFVLKNTTARQNSSAAPRETRPTQQNNTTQHNTTQHAKLQGPRFGFATTQRKARQEHDQHQPVPTPLQNMTKKREDQTRNSHADVKTKHQDQHQSQQPFWAGTRPAQEFNPTHYD
jgi:hypothetical protein